MSKNQNWKELFHWRVRMNQSMKSGSRTNQLLTNGKAIFIQTNHQASQLST